MSRRGTPSEANTHGKQGNLFSRCLPKIFAHIRSTTPPVVCSTCKSLGNAVERVMHEQCTFLRLIKTMHFVMSLSACWFPLGASLAASSLHWNLHSNQTRSVFLQFVCRSPFLLPAFPGITSALRSGERLSGIFNIADIGRWINNFGDCCLREFRM